MNIVCNTNSSGWNPSWVWTVWKQAEVAGTRPAVVSAPFGGAIFLLVTRAAKMPFSKPVRSVSENMFKVFKEANFLHKDPTDAKTNVDSYPWSWRSCGRRVKLRGKPSGMFGPNPR